MALGESHIHKNNVVPVISGYLCVYIYIYYMIMIIYNYYYQYNYLYIYIYKPDLTKDIGVISQVMFFLLWLPHIFSSRLCRAQDGCDVRGAGEVLRGSRWQSRGRGMAW